jgi:hypothetical protein
LEQRIETPAQEKWVSKLLGFDFTMEYKRGRENMAADALSRRDAWQDTAGDSSSTDSDQTGQETMNNQAINTIQPTWVRELTASYAENPELQQLIHQFQQGALDRMKYQLHNDLLFYKGRIHLGTLKPFQQQILQQFYSNPLAGHMGAQKTYSRLKKEFYWPGMQEEVRSFIKDCEVCKRNKTETIHPAGLLQPLSIPDQNWTEVSIDFVEGLPPSQGKDGVFVVVDRLSKYDHFTSLSHPYTAT